MTGFFTHSDKARHLADVYSLKDPLLKPYQETIARRLQKVMEMEDRLTQNQKSLADFAAGHEFFGLHFKDNEWIFREWAPNADALYFIGEITDWQEVPAYRLQPKPNGVWDIRLPADALKHLMLYRLRIHWPGGAGDRIPAYARRVVQNPDSGIFNAKVWHPSLPY